MAHFEKVREDDDLPLPTRATKDSAGYDLVAARDIVIPPSSFLIDKIQTQLFEDNPNMDFYGFLNPIDLNKLNDLTKSLKARPTLVPTGVRCVLDEGQYLQVSSRSSTPLRYWLILANGVGIVDRDFAFSPESGGEICLQFINLSPCAIQIHRGDRLAQGIICSYAKVENDVSEAERIGGAGSTG